MNVIPAIDLRGGQCVRLFQGDFDRQTEYAIDPVTVAQTYAVAGMTRLHIVDLDGARSGRQGNHELIRSIVNGSDISVQLGGGIRELAQVEAWLDAGVTRVLIGTLAITETQMVGEWMLRFGPERIALALDVNIGEDGVPRIATHGWARPSETTLWQCIDTFAASGLQHVLCTDISRDGAMAGPNVALYSELVARYPGLSLQASGGVRDMRDLERLRAGGVAAAICGRALLDGRISAGEIEQFLRAA